MTLIKPLTLVVWSFVIEFIYCEFSERVCTRFEAVDDKISEIEWYVLPVEIQKMAPIIMMSTQKPVFLRGFANAVLSRETFKKVTDGKMPVEYSLVNIKICLTQH